MEQNYESDTEMLVLIYSSRKTQLLSHVLFSETMRFCLFSRWTELRLRD